MDLGMKMKVTVKRRQGIVGTDLFRFFDNGIRKRLPKLVAREYYDTIIKNINENTFNFVLSEAWVKSKKRRGADTRPFIEFGAYKDAITIKTRDGHLSVGFKQAQHPRAKMTVGRLALILEYGDLARNIPARPLWRRTTEEFQRNLRRRMKVHAKKALNGT